MQELLWNSNLSKKYVFIILVIVGFALLIYYNADYLYVLEKTIENTIWGKGAEALSGETGLLSKIKITGLRDFYKIIFYYSFYIKPLPNK